MQRIHETISDGDQIQRKVELGVKLDAAINDGNRFEAVRLQGQLLGLQEVELPRGVNPWRASRVPLAPSGADPATRDFHNSRAALNVQHKDYGLPHRPARPDQLSDTTTITDDPLLPAPDPVRAEALALGGERALWRNITVKAVRQVGRYSLEGGGVTWSDEHGDLATTWVDDARPITLRTHEVLTALEDAGYQNDPDAGLGFPVQWNNPAQVAQSFVAQQ